MTISGIQLGRGLWFLVTRVALLGVCVAVPVAFGYALGFLCITL